MGTLLKFLLIALAVAWLLYSPAVRGKVQGRPRGNKSPQAPSGPQDHAAGGASAVTPLDTMVACAHCGVHLPQSETVSDTQGRRFCSPAHRDRNRT
jgi:uncharacterized protein